MPPLAVASLLLGATLWGVMWYPLRLLEGYGVTGLWSSLIIYVAALAVAPLTLLRGAPRPRRADLGWIVAMLLFGGWCSIGFILAVIHGDVVRVLLLFYLSPVWVLLLGRMFLGEALTPRALSVTALALTGAAVMLYDPDSGLPLPRDVSDWQALSAGFAFAVCNILVRGHANLALGYKTVTVWLGVVLFAGAMLLVETPPAPVSWFGIGAAALFGVLVLTIMTSSVQYGVTHLPTQRSSVIMLFEIVAGAVSAWALAGEALGMQEWIGGALIVLAAWRSATAV